MDFEFDSTKSVANAEKHGIDFVAAQELWLDVNMVVLPAREEQELRWLHIGKINGVVWAAIVTRRHENIRIISVRRAREREVYVYYSE